MLTATELAALRNTLNLSLPDSGTISRKTWASDGEGGGTEQGHAVLRTGRQRPSMLAAPPTPIH